MNILISKLFLKNFCFLHDYRNSETSNNLSNFFDSLKLHVTIKKHYNPILYLSISMNLSILSNKLSIIFLLFLKFTQFFNSSFIKIQKIITMHGFLQCKDIRLNCSLSTDLRLPFDVSNIACCCATWTLSIWNMAISLVRVASSVSTTT